MLVTLVTLNNVFTPPPKNTFTAGKKGGFEVNAEIRIRDFFFPGTVSHEGLELIMKVRIINSSVPLLP